MATLKPRYTVRKQSSGWTSSVKFYVYDTVRKGRVTVHAHLIRSHADAEADQLNISDMVRPHAEDPRPYDVRHAEAEAAYHRRGVTPNASKRTLPPGWTLSGTPASAATPMLPVIVAQSPEFTIVASSSRRGEPGHRYYYITLSAYERATKKDVVLRAGQTHIGASRGAVDKLIVYLEALRVAREVGARDAPS